MRDWLVVKTFWDLTVTGLALGSIYSLVALGYTLVYGVLRLINFAHSEIFMIGTFSSLIAATQLLNIPLLEDGAYPYRTGFTLVLFLVVLLFAAMLMSGIGAVALERVAYRSLRGNGDIVGAVVLAFLTGFVATMIIRDETQFNFIAGAILTAPIAWFYLRLFGRGQKAPRLAFLITAIGASTAIAEAVGIWGGKGREQYQTPRILEKTTLFNLFGTEVRIDYVIVIVGALLMMISLALFVNRTKLGRGVRAVAQDAETARILGVNVDLIILVTFALGGIMAGGAAMLFTLVYDQSRFNIGFILGVKSFTAAVLGGIGNVKGALLGGFLLGLVENYGSAIFGGQWKDVIAFVVLLVVLMFRPNGILGESLGRARV
jgi:branched-chain amino acid transport system permease protein